MSAWGFLGVAIAFEVIGTVLLKMSNGFEKMGPGVAAMLCYFVCFTVFAHALKSIPSGVAYAVWSGVGMVLITLIGTVYFGEKLSLIHYGFIALIFVGALGLNLTTDIHKA